MFRNLGIATLAALMGFIVSTGNAAPGADAPPGGSGEPTARRLQDDVFGSITSAQGSDVPTVDIEGKVVDGRGRPLGGVLVKAFADGLISGSAKTSEDGTFRLAASLVETSGKGSAVLWLQSPNEDHLESQVVLWAGEAASASGLFPPCTQIVPVQAGRAASRVEVTIQTAEERRKDVAASDCLERLVEPRSPR